MYSSHLRNQDGKANENVTDKINLLLANSAPNSPFMWLSYPGAAKFMDWWRSPEKFNVVCSLSHKTKFAVLQRTALKCTNCIMHLQRSYWHYSGPPNRPFRWISVLFRRPIIAYNIRIKVCWKNWSFPWLKFSWYGKCNACCFWRGKNVVLGTKKGQLAYSDRQQQLVNSGNNISFPRIFLSLKIQLAYPNRYIFLSV